MYKLVIMAVVVALLSGCAARKSFLGADPCFYPLEPNTWGCAKEIDTPEVPIERIMVEPGEDVLANRNTVENYWCPEPYVLRDRPIKKAWVRKGEFTLSCVEPDSLITMIEPGEEVVEVRVSDSQYYECPKSYELVTKVGWHATFSCQLPEKENQE